MLKSIQSLRGIAAWLVVFHHIHQLIFKSDIGNIHFSALFEKFASGVDLFFVISGFIIYNCATDSRTTAADFLIKRFFRVAPPYWFYTFLVVALTVIYPGLIFHPSINSTEVIKSILFIPYFNYDYGIYLPFLTVGWTLNYEMFFYAASFMAILFFRKNYALAVSLIMFAIHYFSAYSIKTVQFYSGDIIYEFLIGVYASVIYRSGWLSRIPPVLSVVAIILAVASVYHADNYHDVIMVGIPCGVIVFAALSLERFINRSAAMMLLSKLGDWSYSTYLCHVIVICVFMEMHRLDMINTWTAALFSVVFTLFASVFSYKYIEKASSGIYKHMFFWGLKKA